MPTAPWSKRPTDEHHNPTTNASFGAKGALTAFLNARAAMLNEALSDLAADVHGRIERRHGVLRDEGDFVAAHPLHLFFRKGRQILPEILDRSADHVAIVL